MLAPSYPDHDSTVGADDLVVPGRFALREDPGPLRLDIALFGVNDAE